MGVISIHKHKITLIYNSETTLGKQTYSYVQATKKKILAIDTAKTNITGTQWIEIAENLNLDIAALINKKHPNFTKKYKDSTALETHDWLKIIKAHPEVVRFPVLIAGTRFYGIENPSETVRYIDNKP